MDLIKTILGFTVLTGPLWLIVVTLVAAAVVAVLVAKRFSRPGAKLLAATMVFVLALLVLFGDEIAGRIYFEHLCETEAGVRVYQTVELPAEYWDEEGRPRFIPGEGSLAFDESLFGGRYVRKSFVTPKSRIVNLKRDSYQLRDTQTQSLLGEAVNFVHWGGWLTRNFTPHNSAIGCGRDQAGYFTDVLKRVFKPTESA